MLDPELLNSSSNQHHIAIHVSSRTWSDVHGRLLDLAAGMPSRRACAVHATRALQHADAQGWNLGHLSQQDMCVEEAAYAASPTCDVSRMNQFLQSAAAASRRAEEDGEGLSD